jgi:CHAD domain-containing protein
MKTPDTKEEKWETYLDDRFSRIHIVLEKVNNSFDTTDIHDFRVEVKKLKALIRLFNSAALDSPICQFPKKLNKIYKALGHLREWQLQRQKIISAYEDQNNSPPKSYINKISKKAEQHKRKTGKLLTPLPSMEKEKEKIKKHFHHTISPVTKQSFVEKQMKIIHELLLSGAHDDDSMHYMRKMLKDAQYTLSGSENESEKNDGHARLKTIQAVTSQLGELHDLHIALILLKKELKSLKNHDSGKMQLNNIMLSWQSAKEKIREETLKEIRKMDSAVFSNPQDEQIK